MSIYRKELFEIPEGMIYLDGNSLGPLPKTAMSRLQKTVEQEWGEGLITSWNKAGWMAQPSRVGDQLGRIIGAAQGSVVAGDTLSIKVFQALAAGLEMRPDRKVILSDNGNFPSDLYMAQGLTNMLSDKELRVVDPDAAEDAITDEVAVVMLTEVDYRSSRRHDMAKITKRAHDNGVVMLWDLAHSAGAVDLDIEASGCDLAVGCTYKYLNAGPGAPAFIYVRPDLADKVRPALSGWLGHEAPFNFEADYRPAPAIERMRVGTPSVLQMAVLEEALNMWEDIDPTELRRASIVLSEQFIEEVERKIPELQLASPRDPIQRGSHIAFAHPDGYAAMQAMIAAGVIGDFRAPDNMRFGITPLYLDANDITEAVIRMAKIFQEKIYLMPEFQKRAKVT